MSSHDLSRLMKFLRQEEWGERFDEVMEEHVGAALDAFDLDFDALEELVGPHWSGTIWGCAFEDLISRTYAPDDDNIVDSYLKRRGWNEKAPAKAYMKALRNAQMSLYEVSEIVPGQSLRARDMLRDAGPVLVQERSATQSLKQWDRIAARIVSVNGKNILAGGLLAFSHRAAEELLDGIAATLAEHGADALDTTDADSMLADIAPLLTSAWLFDTLGKMLDPVGPELFTSEGDPVLFHTVRWPIAKGVTQAMIAERLDTLVALEREGAKFWNWLETAPTAPVAPQGEKGLRWDVTMDDGARVLGNVELKGRFASLSVSSAARAERGRALLEPALAGLVGDPLVEIQTMEQMRREQAGDGPGDAPTLDDLPPEELTRLLHQMLDQQYRQTLDQPLPVLGNKTPRAMASTEAGRRKVADWLKYLENGSAGHGPGDPMASYDFGWMWRELGLEGLRR